MYLPSMTENHNKIVTYSSNLYVHLYNFLIFYGLNANATIFAKE